MTTKEYLEWVANNPDENGKAYIDSRDTVKYHGKAADNVERAACKALNDALGGNIVTTLDVRGLVKPWRSADEA